MILNRIEEKPDDTEIERQRTFFSFRERGRKYPHQKGLKGKRGLKGSYLNATHNEQLLTLTLSFTFKVVAYFNITMFYSYTDKLSPY